MLVQKHAGQIFNLHGLSERSIMIYPYVQQKKSTTSKVCMNFY